MTETEINRLYAQVCQQADRIRADADTIMDLIRQRDSVDLLRNCPVHGAEYVKRWTEINRLTARGDTIEQVRLAYVMPFNYLSGLSAKQRAQITPEIFLPWAYRIQAKVVRRHAGLPDLEPVSLRKPSGKPMIGDPGTTPADRDPLTAIPWTDVARRLAYWQKVDQSQRETLATNPAAIAKYTAERDAAQALRADCGRHAGELEWLDQQIEYLRTTDNQTTSAVAIFSVALADAVKYARHADPFDPHEMVKVMDRASKRAYRTWNPPIKKGR